MYNSRFDRQNRHSMNTPRRGTRDEPWRDRESFRNDNDFDRFSRGYYPSRDDINSQSRYGSRRYQQGRYDREREQQYPYEEQRQYGYSHTSTGIGENYVSDRGIDDGRIEFDRNRSTYAPLYSQEEGQRLSSYGSNYEPSSWTQEYRNRENEGGLWQSVKNFFGKGPKGYRRSSERIKEDVSEALYRHPEIDASEIEVSVQGGEVVLKGSVEDRRTKRMAEDCAQAVPGVEDVRNELRVQSGSSLTTTTLERPDKTSKNSPADRMM